MTLTRSLPVHWIQQGYSQCGPWTRYLSLLRHERGTTSKTLPYWFRNPKTPGTILSEDKTLTSVILPLSSVFYRPTPISFSRWFRILKWTQESKLTRLSGRNPQLFRTVEKKRRRSQLNRTQKQYRLRLLRLIIIPRTGSPTPPR